ncbi:MAG: caspase family protein [Anaerolineales bacterium]|nr:caspase family protein [Anaerolineales bacterium]
MSLISSYSTSYALVIGINNYLHASPLGYAISDAEAVGKILQDRFSFPNENITLLFDKDASRNKILKEFMSFTSDAINENDRIFIFFAGHGFTTKSRRSDVGFLVPQDGSTDELGSLIRWDELTRNADLIPAKHILFVMDACYGGTAITRALQPGAMRFLKDMLLRPSRQVITAGKADELVADLGGPRPNHSVFTGHFLDALDGNAADTYGVITANGVMNYVYQKVAQDRDSYQTPHFGYLDGDGDFIFSAPILSELQENKEEDKDILIAVSSPLMEDGENEHMNTIDKTKEFLSNSLCRIKLHDLVAENTRAALTKLSDEEFSLQTQWSVDEFSDRLEKYQIVASELLSITSLMGYWGTIEHKEIMSLPSKRLASRLQVTSGNTVWIALRWYPILLLTYSTGLAAVAANNYENLYGYFSSKVTDPSSGNVETPIIQALYNSVGNLHDAFKLLPGHERQFVPISEYLFKYFQPLLDDLLFLGSDYEATFDRLEILISLEHAYERVKGGHRLWGPVGRFGWKTQHGNQASPLHRLINEAKLSGTSWAPLKAGFFDGSSEVFEEISSQSLEQISKRGWY